MADPIVSLSYDDADIQRLLRDLMERAANVRPALRDIAEEILVRVDRSFEEEIDPYGVAWAPLSARTVSWKTQNSRILKILQSTGRLRASITYQVGDDQVVVGTNVAYAKKPQLGIGQPQRQFLGIGDELRDEIVAILGDYVMGDEA